MFAGISFIVAFGSFLILERVLNASAFLLLRVATGETGGIKGYASMQLIGSSVTYVTSFAASVSSSLIVVAASLASYALWVFLISSVFVMLYITQQYYPEIIIDSVDYWNTNIGQSLNALIVIPLQLIDILFSAIVPIYNYFVWISVQFFGNIFLKTALDDIVYYKDIGFAIASLCTNLVLSFTTYIDTLMSACQTPVTDICYDAGPRTFDLITPMKDLRSISISLSTILFRNCASIGSVASILLYPWIDINFAKGIHNIVNSILFTVFQVPVVTFLRCANNNKDLVMCLPDFEPSFDMMSAGLRNFGMLLDNWIDISSVLLQDSVGIDTSSTNCEQVSLALTAVNYSSVLFGKNETVIVGLTDGLYGVTDGVHVQYFNHYNTIESVTVSNAWPIQIDVGMGVAAVTYFKDVGIYPLSLVLRCLGVGVWGLGLQARSD
jgi:hypothetical protein